MNVAAKPEEIQPVAEGQQTAESREKINGPKDTYADCGLTLYSVPSVSRGDRAGMAPIWHNVFWCSTHCHRNNHSVLHTVTETIIQAAAHVFQLKCSVLRHKTHHLMYSNQLVNEWHIHACTSIEQVTDTHLHICIEHVTDTHLHKYWTCDRYMLAHILNMWQPHTCTHVKHVTDTHLHKYWTGDTHTLAHVLNRSHTHEQVLNKWHPHTCTSIKQVTDTHLHKYWTNDTHTLAQVLNKWQTHTCTSTEQVRHTLAQVLSKWHTHLHKFPLPAKSCYHYCSGKTKVF